MGGLGDMSGLVVGKDPGLLPTTFFLSTSLSMPDEIIPTRSKVAGFAAGSGMNTFGFGAAGEPRGVVSLERGGVTPLTIFIGDMGDLISLSESKCPSEKLLMLEFGLELSALELGLEELFFLGEGLSSLYTTLEKLGGNILICST